MCYLRLLLLQFWLFWLRPSLVGQRSCWLEAGVGGATPEDEVGEAAAEAAEALPRYRTTANSSLRVDRGWNRQRPLSARDHQGCTPGEEGGGGPTRRTADDGAVRAVEGLLLPSCWSEEVPVEEVLRRKKEEEVQVRLGTVDSRARAHPLDTEDSTVPARVEADRSRRRAVGAAGTLASPVSMADPTDFGSRSPRWVHWVGPSNLSAAEEEEDRHLRVAADGGRDRGPSSPSPAPPSRGAGRRGGHHRGSTEEAWPWRRRLPVPRRRDASDRDHLRC